MPRGYLNENGDVRVGKVIFQAVLAVLALIVLFRFLPFTVVGAGQRGVVTTLGKVDSNVLGEGLHLVNPISHVHKLTVQTQTVRFDNEKNKGDDTEGTSLFAASKDLQDVQIATVVNYHLNPLKVNVIYQQYGDNYQSNVINPMIRETVKSISAQYTAEELVTKRVEFSDKVATLLGSRFAEKDSFLERFNVVNFEFSKSFSDAIEAKVTAEQTALAAKNKLEQVKYEAQQQIEKAKAEAESIRIQAQAVTQQGGKDYVELQRIGKWNGAYPQYYFAGNSTPLINLGK